MTEHYYDIRKLIADIPTNWSDILQQLLTDKNDNATKINDFLNEQHKIFVTPAALQIYPPRELIFNAFTKFNFENTKVVILGQDPYINPKEAMGLSFSVPNIVKIPPSLKNIYKEIASDLDYPQDKYNLSLPHGNLTSWANQGVLLLNAALTVLQGNSGNNHMKVWESFTNAIIKYIADNLDGVVFILWGNYAKSKASLIANNKDNKDIADIANKHCIITGVHPSPLSASKGFFGGKYFSKTNDYLKSKGKAEINWKIE
jgi:uracil-DNA glycosylase